MIKLIDFIINPCVLKIQFNFTNKNIKNAQPMLYNIFLFRFHICV